jgi:hypothetical protein
MIGLFIKRGWFWELGDWGSERRTRQFLSRGLRNAPQRLATYRRCALSCLWR